MMARYAVVLALMAPLASGSRIVDDKKDDKDLLQGEWVVVSVDLVGKAVEKAQDKTLVVKGDDWSAPSGSKFKFKIDATKNPKQLDLMGALKGGQEQQWPGIYKIEGDTFTFCRSQGPSGARPTEFEGGPGVVLMVFKRAAK
jgi:uncharacterized protein (TIGR03067 family)